MRRTLDLSVKQLLRSRTGIAVVLFVLVLVVVGLARLFSGGGDDGGAALPPDSAVPVSAPAAGPSSSEDGVVAVPSAPTPKTSPGTADPEAVGLAFAAAWVNHRDVSTDRWYGALLPHATSKLADRLKGVDPASVPAERLTGDPVVVPYADQLVDVTIAVDSGQLTLRLVSPEGRWLVDGVDWERA